MPNLENLPLARIVNGNPQLRKEIPDHLRVFFPSPRSKTGYATALIRAFKTPYEHAQALAWALGQIEAAEEAYRRRVSGEDGKALTILRSLVDQESYDKILAEMPRLDAFRFRVQINEAAPIPETKAGFTIEQAIQCLCEHSKTQPKNKSLRARRRKMELLFAYFGKPDDLTSVSPAELGAYKAHLIRTSGTTNAQHHLTTIRKLYSISYANHPELGVNPAAAIMLPARRDGETRLPISDADAQTILDALAGTESYIEWPTRIMLHLGLICEEIVDARTTDVERVRDVVVLHIRGAGRLKTKNRTRDLPLPTVIADAFWRYVEGVRASHGAGPLFPQIAPDRDGIRSNKVGQKIRDFIRGLGLSVTPYSFRHRVMSQLKDMRRDLDPDTRRYIGGHRAKDTHAESYLHFEPWELLPFIDRLNPVGPVKPA